MLLYTCLHGQDRSGQAVKNVNFRPVAAVPTCGACKAGPAGIRTSTGARAAGEDITCPAVGRALAHVLGFAAPSAAPICGCPSICVIENQSGSETKITNIYPSELTLKRTTESATYFRT